jgi:hypothetical protein
VATSLVGFDEIDVSREGRHFVGVKKRYVRSPLKQFQKTKLSGKVRQRAVKRPNFLNNLRSLGYAATAGDAFLKQFANETF